MKIYLHKVASSFIFVLISNNTFQAYFTDFRFTNRMWICENRWKLNVVKNFCIAQPAQMWCSDASHASYVSFHSKPVTLLTINQSLHCCLLDLQSASSMKWMVYVLKCQLVILLLTIYLYMNACICMCICYVPCSFVFYIYYIPSRVGGARRHIIKWLIDGEPAEMVSIC